MTMMHIQWDESYKLGIPAIDSDHKALLDLLNRFLAASTGGAEPGALADILHDLIEQTREHFAREETMLDRNDYPDLARHRAEHHRLLEQAKHFQERYAAGAAPRDLSMETAEFLQNWLVEHIARSDKPYRPFILRLT
jgi:hemerythrin-like metal-binding protein